MTIDLEKEEFTVSGSEEFQEDFKEEVDEDIDFSLNIPEVIEEEGNPEIDLEEVKNFIEDKDDDFINLSELEVLKFKNYNLQLSLAEKNIENMQLRQSLILHEKKEVLNSVMELKKEIEKKNKVDIANYVADITNSRFVHKRLLEKK